MSDWKSMFRLAFDDPDLEARWHRDNFEHSRKQVQIAVLIAMLIGATYGAADPIILPPGLSEISLWPQRLVIVAAFGAVLLLSLSVYFERFWQQSLILGTLAAVGVLTWMWLILETSGGVFHASIYWFYHNGLVLIVIYAFLFLRLTFKSAAVVAGATMAAFIIIAFVRPEPQINLIAVVSMAFVCALGLVAVYGLETTERRVYKQRILIDEQRQELEASLKNLQTAHQQLVQAEKMASLGHLASGIAHELRNPLNFVANFAAISDGMHEELTSLNDPTERDEFLGDLKMNTRKILEHARRADQIVQRLIEHADHAGGSRELTDLNKLISTGIETAVMRFISKYQAEPAAIATDLHPGPLEAEVAVREITRVVVNLLDNALYSVHRKRSDVEDLDARITVRSSRDQNRAVLEVLDNGVGISEQTRHRIFEPFFTTRQTGDGAGLGLYVCYQIVLGHGGDMTFKSEDGEWASFEVRLPVPLTEGPS